MSTEVQKRRSRERSRSDIMYFVVERTEGSVVPWLDALEPQRFVRLLSLSIENYAGTDDRAHRRLPRLDLVLGSSDASEVLRIRCSGVEGKLEVGNVTGGGICALVVRDIAAWAWEGIRYSVEAEDVLSFYCQEMWAHVERNS